MTDGEKSLISATLVIGGVISIIGWNSSLGIFFVFGGLVIGWSTGK